MSIEQGMVLLKEKQSLLKHYLEITLLMNEVDEERLLAYVEKREKLIEEISKVDHALKTLEVDQEIYHQVIHNIGYRNDYAHMYQPSFDLAQENFSVLHQIKQAEEVVFERVCQLQEVLKQKMVTNNRAPKINHYLKNSEATMEGQMIRKNQKA